MWILITRIFSSTGFTMILVGMLFTCSIILFANHKEITNLQGELLTCSNTEKIQNQAILKWEQEGKEEQAKIADAQKEAAHDQAISQKDADALLHAEVSDNCLSAIGWLVDQSKNY